MNLQRSQPEPIHNLWGRPPSPLDPIFAPAAIAVIGATEREGSVGRALLENLARSFAGRVYPVNPKRSEILVFANANPMPAKLATRSE